MYQLRIQDRAVKSFKKISEPYKTLIKRKMELLKDFSNNLPNIKALQGEYRKLYRLRVGDYRVIFDVKEKEIVVVDIFARGKGY
ncbi:MAG: type II toxin-antitoxin system RelE/ParE family toxin [Candidatus Margulisbacteria bacterium]|jgi:mRNA interferase RelE/StbE|nr:type II toxin-antitoxin system RelE/ParE family toxin [Candidatus Margulisiibacteriota bacterium]MDR1323229.1 type II toxin-antitoxin system RelE/ParE family toxin [Candidatus Margulisiibacteriota bacterium]